MIAFITPKAVEVATEDGWHVALLKPIDLRREDGAVFRVPPGTLSDGASTPKASWVEIPPFGTYWRACVVHDAAYRGTLQRQMTDGTWVLAMLSKEDSDDLLLWCMMADGVEQKTREIIYEGVKVFGWRSFRDDRTP